MEAKHEECKDCPHNLNPKDWYCCLSKEKPVDVNKCRHLKKDTNVSVPVEQRVKHPCQRMAGMTHEAACKSNDDTRAYKIIADREAYTLINVEVYLCPKCAGEMGV